MNTSKSEQQNLDYKSLFDLVEWVASGAKDSLEKQTNADRLLLEIYKMVHSHRKDACCNEVHAGWRKEAIETYNRIKRLGEI